MINALLWLYGILGNNFFLAIAVFTIVLRLATVPTQIRQQRTAQKMQELQPQVKAIQKKYKDNQQKQMEELRKIGYNPAEQIAGCLPLLIQMPILIGLYRAILIVLGATPQAMLELTERAYSSIDLASLLPIANKFLWLNLAQPDPWLIMPALVFATSFISQRVLTPTKPKDDKTKKQQQEDNPMAGVTESMQYTMPIMFGFFALSFPAGLSVYWVITSLVGFFIGLYTRRHKEVPATNTAGNTTATISPSSADKAIAASSNGADKPVKSPRTAKKSQTTRKKNNRSAKR
jgi:YidC/Oxa1 family membrane protein insertase